MFYNSKMKFVPKMITISEFFNLRPKIMKIVLLNTYSSIRHRLSLVYFLFSIFVLTFYYNSKSQLWILKLNIFATLKSVIVSSYEAYVMS